MRTLLMVALACGVVEARPRPKYEAEAIDLDRLSRIHKRFDRIDKDPRFDGTTLKAGVTPHEMANYRDMLLGALQTFDYEWRNVWDEHQTSDDGRALKAKYDQLRPYADALVKALEIRGKEQTDARATAERDKKAAYDKCNAFWNAIAPAAEHQTVAQFLATNVWLGTVEAVDKMRKYQAAAAPLCANNFADTCTEPGTRRYGDITVKQACEGALAGEARIKEGVMRPLIDKMMPTDKVPTAEGFKIKDGWIPTEKQFLYARDMFLQPDAQKAALATAKPVLDAAKLEIKLDDPAWKPLVDYYATYRAAIEGLAPTLTTPGGKCRGGKWCGDASKEVLAMHKNAKILKTTMDDTVYVGATEAELSGWILFQIPGEKFCQLRSWTVNENLKHSLVVKLYYVRVQQCK